jgi:hypothetical protein
MGEIGKRSSLDEVLVEASRRRDYTTEQFHRTLLEVGLVPADRVETAHRRPYVVVAPTGQVSYHMEDPVRALRALECLGAALTAEEAGRQRLADLGGEAGHGD